MDCTKREVEIVNDNSTTIIPDNTAPPYQQITSIQLDNYINKVYIDLLGREPTDSELQNWNDDLRTSDLSMQARTLFLEEIMSTRAFYQRLFQIYAQAFLGGVTIDDIAAYIALYTYQRDQFLLIGDVYSAQFIQVEIDRLTSLYQAEDEIFQEEITLNTLVARIAYNFFYDEINMGTENFVISCFENFLKRYPTDHELTMASRMVDGGPATLLHSDGTSKLDLIEIVTNNPEFDQGLIADLYERLLSRPASPEEMNAGILKVQEDGFEAAQISIMISDDYAGF